MINSEKFADYNLVSKSPAKPDESVMTLHTWTLLFQPLVVMNKFACFYITVNYSTVSKLPFTKAFQYS